MLRLYLLASQMLLILVQEEGTVGGQRLEDVRHGAEAVLGGGLRLLRQEPLLGADGTKLEVFTVHGDVGGQGLQVQFTEVRLRTEQRPRCGEGGITLRMLFQPPTTPSLQQGLSPPPHALAQSLIPVAHQKKTQICLPAVWGSWPVTLAFPRVRALFSLCPKSPRSTRLCLHVPTVTLPHPTCYTLLSPICLLSWGPVRLLLRPVGHTVAPGEPGTVPPLPSMPLHRPKHHVHDRASSVPAGGETVTRQVLKFPVS